MPNLQFLAHLLVDGRKILVLARPHIPLHGRGHPYVAIKLRNGGQDGLLLRDESKFLKEAPQVLEQILCGEVVKL